MQLRSGYMTWLRTASRWARPQISSIYFLSCRKLLFPAVLRFTTDYVA